jgi:DNA-directed RNA polymerase specialized sigma subunit
MSKDITLSDILNELETNNRLVILSLVRQGVPQKDIASAVGISEGALSKMFPKGLLKHIASISKGDAGSALA